jgi:hypothetical protein
MIRYAAITWIAVTNTMCFVPLPTEGIWEVEVTAPPVGSCTDRRGVPFDTPPYLAFEHRTPFDGISMYWAAGHVMTAGRLYARTEVDGRDFSDTGERPWLVFNPGRFCSYHLKRVLSGRQRNRNTIEWSETAMWFSGHRDVWGNYEPCMFPLDDPTISEDTRLARLPDDLHDMPYDEAKAAWEARFPHHEDPCIEERSYRATYFAEELPPRPPRPRNAPVQTFGGHVVFLSHVAPPTTTDGLWDYNLRWSVTHEGDTTITSWALGRDNWADASVRAGPVHVTLERKLLHTGNADEPWEPVGPTRTVFVGERGVATLLALGHAQPAREGDRPLSIEFLPDFPNLLGPWQSYTQDWWPYDEPLRTRFVHAHPDAEYETIDLWYLDDACRPLRSPPSHRGLEPGDYLTDLLWPVDQPVVLGIDAAADGTIDHCFRLPPRVQFEEGGPIVSFRRVWDFDADTERPIAIVAPDQSPRIIIPSD